MYRTYYVSVFILVVFYSFLITCRIYDHPEITPVWSGRIVCNIKEYENVSGSCCWVGRTEDGRHVLLTASHVIPPDTRAITVVHGDAHYKARLVARSLKPDLALLTVRGLDTRGLRKSIPRQGRVSRGESLWCFGCPEACNEALIIGRVCWADWWDEEWWVAGQLPISGGNSGSPVVDNRGRLVGIVVSVSGNLTWIVPSEDVQAFLNAYGVK